LKFEVIIITVHLMKLEKLNFNMSFRLNVINIVGIMRSSYYSDTLCTKQYGPAN